MMMCIFVVFGHGENAAARISGAALRRLPAKASILAKTS